MFAPAPAPAAEPQNSYFQELKKTPFYPLAVNGILFAAGVWFIQSPLMDLMKPEF